MNKLILTLLLASIACTANATAVFEVSCEQVLFVQAHGHPGLATGLLQLTPAGSSAWHRFTQAHVGEDVAVAFGGDVVTRLQCEGPNANGILMLSDAQAAAAVRIARRDCPDRVRSPGAPRARPSAMWQPPELEQAAEFTISCSMLERMELWDMRGQPGADVVQLVVTLTPAVGRTLAQRMDSIEPVYILNGDQVWDRQYLRLQVDGKAIRSELPLLDAFGSGVGVLTWRTLAAALDAARMICPDKVPSELLRLDLHGREIGREAIAPGPSPGADAP